MVTAMQYTLPPVWEHHWKDVRCIYPVCPVWTVKIVEVIYDGKRQKEWALTTPRYVPDFERVKILLGEANVALTEWYAPES